MPNASSGRIRFLAAAAVLAICVAGCPPPTPDPFETKTFLLPGDVPLEMIYLPAGTFLMGRYPGEQDSVDSQDPQHQVTVAGFWMDKYELTIQNPATVT